MKTVNEKNKRVPPKIVYISFLLKQHDNDFLIWVIFCISVKFFHQ